VIGGAQLGLAYGLANRSGRPTVDAVREMLSVAAAGGATTIDTAAAYGDSESVIGAVLAADVALRDRLWAITKIAPDVGEAADAAGAVLRLRASVDESRRRLRQDHLPLVLLHRAGARTAFGGALWEVLVRLIEDGVLGAIGVSVYAPEEVLAAIADPHVAAIQVPLSVLDRRMVAAGVPELCLERGVALFARSVFMQGALAVPDLPPGSYPEPLGKFVARFGAEATHRGCSGAGLALAYARAIPGVAGLVVGAESAEQVLLNLALFGEEPLGPSEAAEIEAAIGRPNDELVDISRWNRPPG
jgi:aryl-alcohol dehydrogenase-like predicted oxidoreductase